MPAQSIELSSEVEADREKCLLEARAAFEKCLAVASDKSRPLHVLERDLLSELMSLGVALVAVWLTLRLPSAAAATLTRGRASYRFRGLRSDVVRTRFGVVKWRRPLYERVHGRGPATVAPDDRAVGLASGRMTLGVHLTAAYFAAKLPFDQVVDVFRQFAGYVPSKRTILGIVDKLGPHAITLMKDMPVPDDDGEVLVIQNDDKGAGMISKREHARRCRPHKKRYGKADRGGRRRKRLANPRPRRAKGEKSKNARMCPSPACGGRGR